MNIFPSCLTQIPANHRQLSGYLTTPHTDSSKSQATNPITYHASRRYQQIAGNKSYILPCLTQLPANHRQQIVHLAMPHIDTSKSHAANRASYRSSYRRQQITGNKPYTLPCLPQIPANQRQKVVHLAMSHTTQIPANHKQQIVHLIMPYTDTLDNKSYILPCLKQVPASHRQQAVHLSIPHTDTSIRGNKPYILPCLTQLPANHKQQSIHLAMPHTDTKPLETDNTMTDQNPRNGQHRDRPKPLKRTTPRQTKTPRSKQHPDRPQSLETDDSMTDQTPQKRTTP